MNPAVKMIIGIIVLLIGLYWYIADLFGQGLATFGIRTVHDLGVVFFGIFGLILILIGFVIAWIEYEDIKWEREEKKNAKKE